MMHHMKLSLFAADPHPTFLIPDRLHSKLGSNSLPPRQRILRAARELQCENGRLTEERIENGSWKEGREAAQGGCCPGTDGIGKQGKEGGLTHKNREDSFTKPGGVMEDFLKNSS